MYWFDAESTHAEIKYRYINNGYSYDPKISQLFLEIHCQYGQKKWWKNIGNKKSYLSIPQHLLNRISIKNKNKQEKYEHND